MLNPKTDKFYPAAEEFIKKIYNFQVPSDYFWNMVYLAKLTKGVQSKLQQYTGPYGVNDFLDRVKSNKYPDKKSQDFAYELACFYDNLQTPMVQEYMEWVLCLLPLMFNMNSLQSDLDEINWRESDCYNTIILHNKAFQDQKFNYILLSKIISNMQQRNLNNTDNYATYSTARFFRSICPYAMNSHDSKIVKTMIDDNVFFTQTSSISEVKINYAERALSSINKQLVYTIKESDSPSDIRNLCDEANRVIKLSGDPNLARYDNVDALISVTDIVKECFEKKR